MNKFLKHKLRVLSTGLSDTILPHQAVFPHSRPPVTNRNVNAALKALNALPEMLLLKNNSEIAILLKSIDQNKLEQSQFTEEIDKLAGKPISSVNEANELGPGETEDRIRELVECRRIRNVTIVKHGSSVRKLVGRVLDRVYVDHPESGTHLQLLRSWI